MPEAHFAGLREYSEDTARQPDFDTICRRTVQVRKRRRHTTSTVVAGLTAVAVAAFALSIGPREGERSAGPNPSASASWDPNAGFPRWTAVEAAAADELYAVTQRCRTCEPQLNVSADAGRTWERRTVPPTSSAEDPTNRLLELRALAPGVLLWVHSYVLVVGPSGSSPSGPVKLGTAAEALRTSNSGQPPTEREWISIDGGRTWRRPGVDQQPVASVPAGTRIVDCDVVKQETPCPFYAVDPAAGRFAPLATQPVLTYQPGWLGDQTDGPVGSQLWVPGLDPATRKPAVAASVDNGRSWHTYVFADGVPAVKSAPVSHAFTPTMYLPAVAAGSGGTAYAQLYHSDGDQVSYRTTDGGFTWASVGDGPLPETPDAGFVTSDGAHVVKVGADFRASRNGGPYQPANLAGYPRKLRELTQVTSFQATGQFVVTSGDDLYVSDDGWTWRGLAMP